MKGAQVTLGGPRAVSGRIVSVQEETVSLGDGKGTTKLDRDPRNFQAGGFSYGNTPEAIARTITYGIPGSPMPSFEKALDAAQRLKAAKEAS